MLCVCVKINWKIRKKLYFVNHDQWRDENYFNLSIAFNQTLSPSDRWLLGTKECAVGSGGTNNLGECSINKACQEILDFF